MGLIYLYVVGYVLGCKEIGNHWSRLKDVGNHWSG